MAGVKAAEVSAILKQQLAGFEATATLDEVGTVLQVEMVSQGYTDYPMPNMVNWLNLKADLRVSF